jgi:hypothetical protein
MHFGKAIPDLVSRVPLRKGADAGSVVASPAQDSGQTVLGKGSAEGTPGPLHRQISISPAMIYHPGAHTKHTAKEGCPAG